MKTLLLAAGLSLAMCACTTNGGLPPGLPSVDEQAAIAAAVAAAPKADRAEILVAVTAEVGARFRCPRNPLELQILAGVRLAFDVAVRPRIQPASADLVDELRANTNEACGLVEVRDEPSPLTV